MTVTPDRIDCTKACVIPADVRIAEVPVPRHNWGDVFVCPNDGCGRAFLVTSTLPADGEGQA